MPKINFAENKSGKVLTKREEEVLLEILEGKNNTQIAKSLVISKHTVKVHVGSILQKLGVTGKVQAVVQAFRNGWIKFKDE